MTTRASSSVGLLVHYSEELEHSPLHDDQETLLALVGVLEDVPDIDSRLAATGSPAKVDLTSRLPIVFQNLQKRMNEQKMCGQLDSWDIRLLSICN